MKMEEPSMAWKDTYPKDRAPSAEEIDACVGSPLLGGPLPHG